MVPLYENCIFCLGAWQKKVGAPSGMNLIKKSGPQSVSVEEGKKIVRRLHTAQQVCLQKSMITRVIRTSHPAREGVVSVMPDALGVIVTHSAVHAHSGGVVAAHGLVADEASVAWAAPE